MINKYDNITLTFSYGDIRSHVMVLLDIEKGFINIFFFQYCATTNHILSKITKSTTIAQNSQVAIVISEFQQ